MWVELAVIIVLLIIIILIGVPDPQNVYLTSDTYDSLEKFEEEKELQEIVDEVSKLQPDTWKSHPDMMLWKNDTIKKEMADKWTIFPLMINNNWMAKNCEMVPKLTAMLKEIPDVESASLTALDSKSQLEPYCGWAELSNDSLRSHMLLTKDKDETSGLIIGTDTTYYEYGKWTTYDDSVLHSEINTSAKRRIVLAIDLPRPSNISSGSSPNSFKAGPQTKK